mmetsp:Transcript_16915/g.27976  ORF Transcript_16915/g.27976 Transcript_16915/m.27976 type:complete len:87 (-) Transcript_16915:126-386(-)
MFRHAFFTFEDRWEGGSKVHGKEIEGSNTVAIALDRSDIGFISCSDISIFRISIRLRANNDADDNDVEEEVGDIDDRFCVKEPTNS